MENYLSVRSGLTAKRVVRSGQAIHWKGLEQRSNIGTFKKYFYRY